MFMFICVLIVTLFILLYFIGSSYLYWDYSNSELVIVGTLLHGFEFIFVRIASIMLFIFIVVIIITYKKQ